jgi:hypothetical protein
MTATVYTNIVGTQYARQYAMTGAEVTAALGSLGYVTGTVSLSNYLQISSLAGSLAPYVLTTTLSATLATFASLAGTNVFTGKEQFQDLPWADITAWGAVRGQDSTAAIQAAIDHMNANYSGGYVFIPPVGFVIGPAGITLKSGVILMGSGQNSSFLDGAGQDSTVVTFDGSCNWAGIRDVVIYGFQSTVATQNAVVVSVGAPITMHNVIIIGGNYALDVRGQGRFYNVAPQGSKTGCVLSSGSSFFTDCSFDVSSGVSYAYYRAAPNASGGYEDQLVDCDMSGAYVNSVHIDDGTAQRVRTKLIGCIISSPVVVVNHGWTLLSGCEIGTPAGFTLTSTNPVTIMGCYAQGSSTVTLAGTNVILAANYQIVA